MINKKLVETPAKMMNRMEEITDLICEYNDEVQKQQEENTRLQQRIDKAIEYIETHQLNFKKGTTTFGSERLSMEERKLLDILKGSEQE